MRDYAPNIITFLTGLLVGWFTHALTIRRESQSRRRSFRSKIRIFADETGGGGTSYLRQDYERISPRVRELVYGIIDDVPRWKRRRFNRFCERYLSLSDDDLRPKRYADENA